MVSVTNGSSIQRAERDRALIAERLGSSFGTDPGFTRAMRLHKDCLVDSRPGLPLDGRAAGLTVMNDYFADEANSRA
ncbi:MAG: hypothetical protein ACLTMP_01385 [Eggerthella lenta]